MLRETLGTCAASIAAVCVAIAVHKASSDQAGGPAWAHVSARWDLAAELRACVSKLRLSELLQSNKQDVATGLAAALSTSVMADRPLCQQIVEMFSSIIASALQREEEVSGAS